MAEPSMPLIWARRVTHKSLFDELNIGGLNGIEARFTFSFQEQIPCCSILDEKIPEMKFK